MSAEVTGKIEMRIRQDLNKVPGCSSLLFRRVFLMGFKACLDFLIIELRLCDQHESVRVLEKVRESWPS